MKTIAITIDEDILARVDRVARADGRGTLNRSRIIRTAVRDYVSRLERQLDEHREAAIVHRHRSKLARQAAELVRQQAKP